MMFHSKRLVGGGGYATSDSRQPDEHICICYSPYFILGALAAFSSSNKTRKTLAAFAHLLPLSLGFALAHNGIPDYDLLFKFYLFTFTIFGIPWTNLLLEKGKSVDA